MKILVFLLGPLFLALGISDLIEGNFWGIIALLAGISWTYYYYLNYIGRKRP